MGPSGKGDQWEGCFLGQAESADSIKNSNKNVVVNTEQTSLMPPKN